MFHKKKSIFLMVFLSFMIMISGADAVRAEDVFGVEIFRNEERVLVKESNYLGDVFVSGDEVIIDGNIEGDVFAIGRRVEIKGSVSGSIFVAGGEIVLDAKILGNVYVLGEKITFDSNAGFSQRLYSAGGEISMNTIFDGRGYVYSSNFRFGDLALVRGKLKAYSESIEGGDRQGLISGTFDHIQVDSLMKRNLYSWALPVTSFGSMVAMFFNVMVLGYFVIALWPDTVRSTYDLVKGSWLRVFGYGFLNLIGLPILMVILWASIIGFSTSMIVGAFIILLILVSRVVFSLMFGLFIAEVYNRSQKRAGELQLWHGLAISSFLSTILSVVPAVNIFVFFMATIGGVGVIMVAIKNRLQIKK